MTSEELNAKLIYESCEALLAAVRARDTQITELKESLHYANGTAELAMKHRDIAEKRIAELNELIERHLTTDEIPTPKEDWEC